MAQKKYFEVQMLLTNTLGDAARIEFLHGYLTAIVCAPKMVMMNDWFSGILAMTGEEHLFNESDDIQLFTSTIFEFYNAIIDSLADGSFTPLYSLDADPASVTPDSARIWCGGFKTGVFLWETGKKKKLDDETIELLTPVYILSDTTNLEGLGLNEPQKKMMRVKMLKMLPSAVAILYEKTQNASSMQ